VFEQRIRCVIGAEGRTHGGNRQMRLTIVPDEGHDFLAQIRIEDGLHITAMERVRALVVETEAVDGIDGVELHAAGVDEIRERADHALAFQFPLIAGAGGKTEERRAPVPVNDNTKFDAQAGRVPTVVVALHEWNPSALRESSMPVETPEEQRVCSSQAASHRL
jgi:hypothetical protein